MVALEAHMEKQVRMAKRSPGQVTVKLSRDAHRARLPSPDTGSLLIPGGSLFDGAMPNELWRHDNHLM